MQQSKNQAQPAPQVVIVKVKRDNGCLWFLAFGWLYPAWLLLKAITVAGWRLFVAWPWRGVVALTRWSVAASRRFTARYGARGWAILAAVVVVLAIIAKITGA